MLFRHALLLSAALALPAAAQTPYVTGLYNTGVAAGGSLLSGYAVDPHYTIVGHPVFGTAYAARLGDGSPIDTGGWLGEPGVSSWINPVIGTSFLDQPGITDDLRYETRFTVQAGHEGQIRIVGRWAADDSGLAILLNGVPVFNGPAADNASWRDFRIETGFVAGDNVLAFDTRSTQSPTGLRVEMLASAVPEPTSLSLLLAGGLLLVLRRRSAA